MDLQEVAKEVYPLRILHHIVKQEAHPPLRLLLLRGGFHVLVSAGVCCAVCAWCGYGGVLWLAGLHAPPAGEGEVCVEGWREIRARIRPRVRLGCLKVQMRTKQPESGIFFAISGIGSRPWSVLTLLWGTLKKYAHTRRQPHHPPTPTCNRTIPFPYFTPTALIHPQQTGGP
jgi:hypothetical protein